MEQQHTWTAERIRAAAAGAGQYSPASKPTQVFGSNQHLDLTNQLSQMVSHTVSHETPPHSYIKLKHGKTSGRTTEEIAHLD